MCILTPTHTPPHTHPAACHMGHHMVSLVFVYSTLPFLSPQPFTCEPPAGCCLSYVPCSFHAPLLLQGHFLWVWCVPPPPHPVLSVQTSAPPRPPRSLPGQTYTHTPRMNFPFCLVTSNGTTGRPSLPDLFSSSREDCILF